LVFSALMGAVTYAALKHIEKRQPKATKIAQTRLSAF